MIRSRDLPQFIEGKEIWTDIIDFVNSDFNPKAGLVNYIRERVSNPELSIGVGGTGKVFDIGNGVCIKMMKNRHADPDKERYDLGNPPKEEAMIQNLLRDFEVSEVYAPNIVGYYAGAKSAAIVMERLDAVNLQMVINGKAKLPKDFELETFFDGLYDYVSTMHEKFAIAHNDLEARNVMIDKKSARARVIDFGRSAVIKANNKSDLFSADVNMLDKLYEKTEDFLLRHQAA